MANLFFSPWCYIVRNKDIGICFVLQDKTGINFLAVLFFNSFGGNFEGFHVFITIFGD